MTRFDVAGYVIWAIAGLIILIKKPASDNTCNLFAAIACPPLIGAGIALFGLIGTITFASCVRIFGGKEELISKLISFLQQV